MLLNLPFVQLVIMRLNYSLIMTILKGLTPFEAVKTMSTTIEDRIILVLREQLIALDPKEGSTIEKLTAGFVKPSPRRYAGHGFWEKIADETGVPSQRWRSVFTRRQKPTPAMIESVAKLWPQYAFWIVTGITDSVNGHIAPANALTFPERLHADDASAERYFRQSIDLNSQLLVRGKVTIESDDERLRAVEREWKLGRWREGDLRRAAYFLSGSWDYRDLISTWKEREERRPERVSLIAYFSQMEIPNIKGPATTKRETRAENRHPDLEMFYRAPETSAA